MEAQLSHVKTATNFSPTASGAPAKYAAETKAPIMQPAKRSPPPFAPPPKTRRFLQFPACDFT